MSDIISVVESWFGSVVTDFDSAYAALQTEVNAIIPNASLLEASIIAALKTSFDGITADIYSKLKSFASLAVAKAIQDGTLVLNGTDTWEVALADFESYIATQMGLNSALFSKDSLMQLIANSVSFIKTFGLPLVASALLPILGPIVTTILGDLVVAI